MTNTEKSNEFDVHENKLLSMLREKGGHAGNMTLQRELGWDANIYWSVRDRLVDKGQLELGKGKGGSVSIVEEQENSSSVAPEATAEYGLYGPVATVLGNEWAKDRRFRSHRVEVTARQGRRETGGTWTRPDIVIAALRVFPYVPEKYFDLVTFEVKAYEGIDVTAVFEALAHRRAATQAYVWLHVPEDMKERGDKEMVLQRIADEARRLGVGLIVGSDPADYSTWDVQQEAVRYEPDPEAMNEFIAQQLPPQFRDELTQWFR